MVYLGNNKLFHQSRSYRQPYFPYPTSMHANTPLLLSTPLISQPSFTRCNQLTLCRIARKRGVLRSLTLYDRVQREERFAGGDNATTRQLRVVSAKRTRVDLHVAESTGLAIERLFSNRLYSSENNAISQPVMHGPFKRPQWRVRWRARLASFRLRPTDQSLESRTVSRFRPNNSYLSASRRVIQLSIRRVISLVPVPDILISFPLLVSLEIRYSIYV